MKLYSLSLHIFRRDLRLEDNSALITALKSSGQVIPCFIFDPRQLKDNPYHSDNCVQFMLSSLKELEQQLAIHKAKLYYFYGIAENILDNLLETMDIEAIFVNRDYTPFSRQRDEAIANNCERRKVDFLSYNDILLHEPEEITNLQARPYSVFTPFYRNAQQHFVEKPQPNMLKNYYKGSILNEYTAEKIALLKHSNPDLWVKGGRKEGLNLLARVATLKDYQETRDFPSLMSTTHLSAHNKFGTVSIREVYWGIVKFFGQPHSLIRELYWRDFFTHIGYHFPHVFKGAFHAEYDQLAWANDADHFKRWSEGTTGFPLVDAGIRQMNTTGYMHNRVRLVAASFLVKDLHIDWRWGERYFAQKLIDYDPAVNNGNWQWVASTGCDAQPYFRIFNPWLQQKKFDPDCIFIKTWLPELVDWEPSVIHKLYLRSASLGSYPMPIVDHQAESIIAKNSFKRVK